MMLVLFVVAAFALAAWGWHPRGGRARKAAIAAYLRSKRERYAELKASLEPYRVLGEATLKDLEAERAQHHI